ncbi:MAG: helix-turn-helix transcriptional regulator [Clostridia bacterium]|nr:helix-turn-helix transcriptional regulator [Clostridia bacterium]
MFYQFEHFGRGEHFCKETGENFSFPIHMHNSFELIIILSGSMDVTVGTTKYTLNKNEAVLVFPHQLHSLSSLHSKHILYIFSPDIVKAFSSKVLQKVPTSNKFVIDEHLLALLSMTDESSSTIEKKGVLYSVCASFDKSNSYTDKASNKNNLLYRIFEFIEREYSKDCLLKQLSEELSYDYAYLSRFFKRNVGITFNEYVNHFRISKACELLSNTDNSVLQCAMECGYSSLRSFNRNFKDIVAVSPTEYKRRHNG